MKAAPKPQKNEKTPGEENVSHIQSNRQGSFLFLSGQPISKFNGIFLNDNLTLFKTIESIGPADSSTRKKVKMAFAHGLNALTYSLEKKTRISIDLDCRRIDDMRTFGRYYAVKQEKGRLIVEFTKKTDEKEDSTHGKEEYSLCVVIEPEGFNPKKDYKPVDGWHEVHYTYDEERNDPPTSRFVYRPFTLEAKVLRIGLGRTKKDAAAALEKLKSYRAPKDRLAKTGCKDKSVVKAFNDAQRSLHDLMTVHDRKARIYAGYPWFCQMWSRDENISLGALIGAGEFQTAKDILFVYLDNIGKDGRLPNRVPSSDLESADGIGWFWKRMGDLMEGMEKQGILDKRLLPDEMRKVKEMLAGSIGNIEKNYLKEGLIHNNVNETWMDTGWNGEDGREGACIEVQAMHLNMLRFMQTLCTDKEEAEMYKKKEDKMKEDVRKRFWDKKTLADRAGDFTIRPNIFIAYYVYPGLLSRKEWRTAFSGALEMIWLDWGGLSSIDTSHHLFTKEYTGRTDQSYHRGDSWYWLNNLTALCLHRNDPKKFKDRIESIVRASAEEIEDHGAIGHHAEVSSASHLSSKGCFAQAWSAAMFIELIKEVYG